VALRGLDRVELVGLGVTAESTDDGTVLVTARSEGRVDGRTRFRHTQGYVVRGSGEVRVSNRVETDLDLPSLPRVGVEMVLVPGSRPSAGTEGARTRATGTAAPAPRSACTPAPWKGSTCPT